MNLNKKIVSILKKKKYKLAVAESCTGGLLSAAITSISGSSKVFTMGLVTYSNKAKTSILKIPKTVIQKHGAVSIQCCLSMVNNLSKISKSKICISITGIAGPKGGTKQKPVGLVFIGIKKGKKAIVSKNQFKNKGRNAIQKATIKKALNLILKQL
ncbi:MAG: damage-inducible protein CinA [Candidatus Pelagibacter sp.]|nr:damage-inducible protein CinA [Candidatus Pelagibacter sp.]RPG11437.1 MAG: CinA family protein [Pelagibacteraceae bacterium TMED170]